MGVLSVVLRALRLSAIPGVLGVLNSLRGLPYLQRQRTAEEGGNVKRKAPKKGSSQFLGGKICIEQFHLTNHMWMLRGLKTGTSGVQATTLIVPTYGSQSFCFPVGVSYMFLAHSREEEEG